MADPLISDAAVEAAKAAFFVENEDGYDMRAALEAAAPSAGKVSRVQFDQMFEALRQFAETARRGNIADIDVEHAAQNCLRSLGLEVEDA